jgi:hypothetical protein
MRDLGIAEDSVGMSEHEKRDDEERNNKTAIGMGMLSAENFNGLLNVIDLAMPPYFQCFIEINKFQRMEEAELDAIDQFVSQKCLIPPVMNAQNLCSICQCPDQQIYRARVQLLFGLNELAGEATRDALIDMMHGAILFASHNSDFVQEHQTHHQLLLTKAGDGISNAIPGSRSDS